MVISGEVERLLKEYRQNQELVRRIGSHYYQIIYPVQLRHHEKMGISTREVGAQKVKFPYLSKRRNKLQLKMILQQFPQRGFDSNYPGGGGRGRSRVCHCLVIFKDNFDLILISLTFRLENTFTELHFLLKHSITNFA